MALDPKSRASKNLSELQTEISIGEKGAQAARS
jgi:hypothetical protein